MLKLTVNAAHADIPANYFTEGQAHGRGGQQTAMLQHIYELSFLKMRFALVAALAAGTTLQHTCKLAVRIKLMMGTALMAGAVLPTISVLQHPYEF